MINNMEDLSASRNSFKKMPSSEYPSQIIIAKNSQSSQNNNLNRRNQQDQNFNYNNNNNKNFNNNQKKQIPSKYPPLPSTPPTYNYIPNNDFVNNGQSRISQRPDLANKTFNQKIKTLGKTKYINQLAQLDYQDKLTQLHTKYSKTSKNTTMKKIKAKNQIAQFIDQEDQYMDQFDQIIDYKHGKDRNKGFHFQMEQQSKNDYYFCMDCDRITNDHSQAHSYLCKNYRQQYQIREKDKQQYKIQCCSRIRQELNKIDKAQAQNIQKIINKVQQTKFSKSQLSMQIDKILKEISNSNILKSIYKKLKQITQF